MNGLTTTIATFDKYAREYQDKYSKFEPYLKSYANFATLLSPDDQVLDIACGPANISQALLQRHPRLAIYGIDLSPKMLEIAREKIPHGTFEQRYIRTLAAIEKRFDAIVCGFAVPYLSSDEVETLLSDVNNLLNPGAYLYISAQLGDYADSAYQENKNSDKVFIHYYSEEFLTNLLEHNGFTIIRIAYNLYDQSEATEQKEIFIQAKKGKSANLI